MEKVANTDFPVHELISKRWSPRAFDPRPVPAQTLRSLLEAARWAPSSFNEQPWRFLLARRENTEEFERMLGCLSSGNQGWARDAGVLILTCVKHTFSRNDKPNRVAEHDIGLAAATLTLQATHLGLVVHQMAGIELDRIRETYSIPQGYAPLTGIAIGYQGSPDRLPDNLQAAEKAPRERKPQREIVYEGTWERPAEW